MRDPQEGTFATHDDVPLFYRHWPAVRPGSRGALILFHRGHEHSGRLQYLVDELDLPEVPMFAWDARGHGRSPGVRGHSPSLGVSVRDVDTFSRHVATAHGVPVEDQAVVAQSVGAVLAATWVHDYAPPIRCLTLASPAFDVNLFVPFARRGLSLLYRLRGEFFVNSYVKARLLTHDPERIASYAADPLIARPIAVHILLALYETAERIVADAGAIVAPTQLLISGADWVVRTAPQHEFFARLGSPVKEKHVLPGFFHDTLGEKERGPVLARVREFVRRHLDAPPALPDQTHADRDGFTAEEHRRLCAPASAVRRLGFAVMRAGLRFPGRLSAGIRLGLTTGFDSGSTLDYVYRNQPEGVTTLGRLIDRVYLASVGWKGIRVRKRHLEELLGVALSRLSAEGLPVRLVDVAAGHGRYVLDAVEAVRRESGVTPEAVLLRDFSPVNVEAGRALIAERGLGATARFEQGDAFDRGALAALDPRPSLAVVSGLYELFPQNAGIQESLAGLAAAVVPGGYLVYTNQPWHPQLELIARTLTSHRGGAAWVMRRRTQAEMDALVRAAGFRKLEQRIDEWGIFSVSLARRDA